MLFEALLSNLIQIGTLDVTLPNGTRKQFGSGREPRASLVIRTRRAMRRLTFNPALALGETYMDGDITPGSGTLFEVLDILTLNWMEGGQHFFDKAFEKFRWVRRWIDQLNSISASRRNVAHHYDLDGRVYSLMLDEDMQYSCAYFPRGDETLEEAQLKKKIHIAAKLKLDQPGLEVVDVGCGWGGMALFLAREYGARVTGLTLSTEQLNVARKRAHEAGLADRVTFQLLDYRNWTGQVDRVVSVGMFEHVGIDHYRTFFDKIYSMLRPNGVALIHAIGRADGPGSTNPWIAKYIFPGGYSPAISEVLSVVEKSGLWATDVEILRLHYAKTLALWREKFEQNRAALANIYDERFCRMFEFYLVASELAFRRAGHMNWQVQLTRDIATLPLSRDYIFEEEKRISMPLPHQLGQPMVSNQNMPADERVGNTGA
ncbi:cyclopropane-fatty-acyl-phospholipid synthase family protein [Rhizobium sp. BG4]|uniref:SAM-dependent methyltransferase n=1 Tax=Rhizobium sp. BG4 TaxID=2613770 RepID=UPI001FEE8361|nr:cyclopropane-fatty-acyl-phospholipid synthase family protein [Rhizobium sp. BG4]